MIKRLTVLFFMILFCAVVINAQNKNVKVQKMQIPSDQNKIVVSQNHPAANPNDPGMDFINTGYDYMCNNTIGPMLTTGSDIDGDGVNDPIFTAMQRFDPAGQRIQMFGYMAFGSIGSFSAFDETAATSGSSTYGWGTVQYCVGGGLDGQALLMAHSNGAAYHSVIDLTNLAPVTPFPTSSFGSNFPSFVYLNDGTIVATTTDANIYSSTDQGATWELVQPIGDGDPNVTDWATAANVPAEYPIYKSDDDQAMAIVAAGDAGSAELEDPNIVYWYGSLDGGATFTGKVIGIGGGTPSAYVKYGQIANRDYAPYFTNFGQLEAMVSNDHVTHVVINGYGEGVVPGATDTTNVFPILYWNSRDTTWMAVTAPSTEDASDGFGHSVSDPVRIYPGNGIGQAYPCVAASDDGHIVVVVWQGYEYTGEIGNSAWNIYPGDGGAETGEVYYTDLYYVVSQDSGKTWTDPAILKGDANVMETYPTLDRKIMVSEDGATATLRYMYMEDAIPGAAIFNGQVAGQNSWSNDTKWLYDSMDFPVTPVGVKEHNQLATSFELSQNYPNPFNPTTLIKYSVAERSNVSLKVYDVLGNEVATLVNTSKEAGSYQVNFDASKLSSGVYIYTLNAGNYTQSKKMLLMK